jgi:class 3 adenylate cyclase
VGAGGTATILFTDLVGSTAMQARLGPEAFAGLRRMHGAVVHEVATEAGGRVVKSTGDGSMAVFAAAAQGVGAAVASADSSVATGERPPVRPWPSASVFSAGDVSEEDADFFGPAVVEAARLCDAAPAGLNWCRSQHRHSRVHGLTDRDRHPLRRCKARNGRAVRYVIVRATADEAGWARPHP